MTALKSLTLASVAMTFALAASPASAAPVMRGIAPAVSPQNELVQEVRWRGRGHHYRGGRYYRRGGNGGAVAAGVIGGLALGAMMGAAASAPPPAYGYAPGYSGGGDWIAYCSSKYRSFDPASGTYLGYDGLRHPCQ